MITVKKLFRLFMQNHQTHNTSQELLQKYFGYDSFRPLQEEIIQKFLELSYQEEKAQVLGDY